jgi:hypothetical protein
MDRSRSTFRVIAFRVLFAGTALAAVAGWGMLAATLRSSEAERQGYEARVATLQTERDRVDAQNKLQAEAFGELNTMRASLDAGRDEVAKLGRARDKAEVDLANAQTELNQLTQRLEQAREKISETGTVDEPAEVNRRPARRGARRR